MILRIVNLGTISMNNSISWEELNFEINRMRKNTVFLKRNL